MLKLLKLVRSLFSRAGISGCVPPSLLFQPGRGYGCSGKQKRWRGAQQLPRMAGTGVARLGADAVFCRAPLLAGTLRVRGWEFLCLKAVLDIKLSFSPVVVSYT